MYGTPRTEYDEASAPNDRPPWGPWGAPPGPWMFVRYVLRGWAIRIAATLAIFVGALVWAVTYLAFLATRFPWYDNLAVVFLTAVVSIAIVAGVWVSWAIGWRRRLPRAWVDSW